MGDPAAAGYERKAGTSGEKAEDGDTAHRTGKAHTAAKNIPSDGQNRFDKTYTIPGYIH
ncbi:Uncharacterised protein [Rikenella microfusus]|uniref:Uncharacterized protein n=1 Tax=Rikenella microfusus TaxID=28139 RepID=A0A379MTU3_9BACT|nr:Uncharacterised protein [Rikenella microfusus]